MEDGQGGRRDVLAPGHPQEHRETSAAAGVVAARGAREPGRALAGVVLYGAGVLAVAVLAWAAGAVPTLGEWAAGGPDLLLVSALASGAAAALAWAWRPLRRAALGT